MTVNTVGIPKTSVALGTMTKDLMKNGKSPKITETRAEQFASNIQAYVEQRNIDSVGWALDFDRSDPLAYKDIFFAEDKQSQTMITTQIQNLKVQIGWQLPDGSSTDNPFSDVVITSLFIGAYLGMLGDIYRIGKENPEKDIKQFVSVECDSSNKNDLTPHRLFLDHFYFMASQLGLMSKKASQEHISKYFNFDIAKNQWMSAIENTQRSILS